MGDLARLAHSRRRLGALRRVAKKVKGLGNRHNVLVLKVIEGLVDPAKRVHQIQRLSANGVNLAAADFQFRFGNEGY